MDSITITAVDSDGTDVSSTIIDSGSNTVSTNVANVWVQAGTAGERYTIDVLATMSSGELINKRLLMTVT